MTENIIWNGIEPLSLSEKSQRDEEFEGFQNLWEKQREKVQSREQFQEFNRRLNREFAIETGLIEGLYTLDRGITQTLIEQGLNAALIPHSSANNAEAKRVISIIRDQEASLQNLRDFVLSERDLSKSYIKELHAQLTFNQDTTEAVDQFGNLIEVPLLRGEWKIRTNNPTRSNGEVQVYCPPIQVDGQMELLCELANTYRVDGVPIHTQAAWLHHRFTQIHPFQDGNGRVARALATLVLLRSHLFPFTVKTEQRDRYISSLEKADAGDIGFLVSLISRQQSSALRQAISVAEEVNKAAVNSAVILSAAKERLAARFAKKSQEQAGVYSLETYVTSEIVRRIDSIKKEIDDQLSEVESISTVSARSSEENSYYFTRDVAEAAKVHGYFADFKTFHSWSFLRIYEQLSSEERSEFTILFSIHPVGKVFDGALTVTAFRTRRDVGESSSSEKDVEVMTEAPFTFFYNQTEAMILSGLGKWLDEAITNSLADWQRSL